MSRRRIVNVVKRTGRLWKFVRFEVCEFAEGRSRGLSGVVGLPGLLGPRRVCLISSDFAFYCKPHRGWIHLIAWDLQVGYN